MTGRMCSSGDGEERSGTQLKKEEELEEEGGA